MNGWIVVSEDGPHCLGRYGDTPKGGVLLRATNSEWLDEPTPVHIFQTAASAKAAITRTKAYAAKKGYRWGEHYFVYPLRATK